MATDNLLRSLKPLSGNDESFSDEKSSQPYVPAAAQDGSDVITQSLQATTIFEDGRDYSARGSASAYDKRRATETVDEHGQAGQAMTTLYVGISATFSESNNAVIAVAIRDAVYLQDFSVKRLDLDGPKDKWQDVVTDHIINDLASYEREVFCKFIGAGIPNELTKMTPNLSSRLWSELDIVPISLRYDEESYSSGGKDSAHWELKCVDEQADSMARKCIMFFGPSQAPLLQVGYRGLVEIDASFRSHMCTVEDYKTTCGDATWEAMMKFASSLKKKGTKIAFFSSTPQGGGVALMRHALARFAKVMGVDLAWYVPKPKPGVFRITKNVHNILQGVANPEERISDSEKKSITDWITDNAGRYWLSEGGPLRDPSEGGADIIMIDDPQMPVLIPLAKKASPNRPVLYRSHIQIRSDLVAEEGSPQADIWEFLWSNIQHADMFISHPIPSFVPKNVPWSKVAYLPATTDWLDGLNKPMKDWDKAYYTHAYNMQCLSMRTTPLKDTKGKYFIQVARFDPSKGIPDVIKTYTEFHRLFREESPHTPVQDIPQLLIVGNSSIDDPDGTAIYNLATHLAATTPNDSNAPSLLPLISIMRLSPNDQLLNTLLSNAHTVLQLSTREGFEVKVSEALHAGRPVIATRTGGIPLQVQHEKNGFLVEPGDWKAAGKRLWELWWDDGGVYTRMAAFAAKSVSDEVGTVGNALAWFWLADRWTGGGGDEGGTTGAGSEKGVKPQGRWVNDLAREAAGRPYVEGENRLPRQSTWKA